MRVRHARAAVLALRRSAAGAPAVGALLRPVRVVRVVRLRAAGALPHVGRQPQHLAGERELEVELAAAHAALVHVRARHVAHLQVHVRQPRAQVARDGALHRRVLVDVEVDLASQQRQLEGARHGPEIGVAHGQRTPRHHAVDRVARRAQQKQLEDEDVGWVDVRWRGRDGEEGVVHHQVGVVEAAVVVLRVRRRRLALLEAAAARQLGPLQRLAAQAVVGRREQHVVALRHLVLERADAVHVHLERLRQPVPLHAQLARAGAAGLQRADALLDGGLLRPEHLLQVRLRAREHAVQRLLALQRPRGRLRLASPQPRLGHLLLLEHARARLALGVDQRQLSVVEALRLGLRLLEPRLLQLALAPQRLLSGHEADDNLLGLRRLGEHRLIVGHLLRAHAVLHLANQRRLSRRRRPRHRGVGCEDGLLPRQEAAAQLRLGRRRAGLRHVRHHDASAAQRRPRRRARHRPGRAGRGRRARRSRRR
mmetsp:Transcript_14521/g.50563  ORF Transcript_14521/g.50563 Transcript_14521/m.50563 type:complete len:481 (-) Transcript_14521:745-2187(-)